MDDSEKVTLEVLEPIGIGFGITLKPGAYIGRRGRSWIGPTHVLELTADEIVAMGGMRPHTTIASYDVSSFVRQGKVDVF